MSAPAVKKLVFLGAKPIGYSCLHHLIAVRDTLGFRIEGVLTRQRQAFGDNADVAALARAAGIPLLRSLEEVPACDILYSVQHHEILREQTIRKAAQIAVNLHMAPLPEYRGCNQFTMAILDDKKEFGTTIHRIDRRIDHGDLLFQQRFPIPERCWVDELHRLTHDASLALFQSSLPDLLAGQYTLQPQQPLEALYGTSLHFRDEINALKQIDLSWDAAKIDRHIRATSMPGFEPPYTLIGSRKVYFSTAKAEPA